MNKTPLEADKQTLFTDMTKLGVPQLMQLKNQVDQEIELFQDSLTNLKLAQAKFQESLEAVEKVKPKDEGRKMLVPLTGSIYVVGNCHDPDDLLIDIGTGYYVKMNLEDSKGYFRRKITFVTKEMEKIQEIGNVKLRSKEVISEMLQLNLANLSMASNPSSS